MRRPVIILLFLLSLLALSTSLGVTGVMLVVGGKARTIQQDFEGTTGFAGIDLAADSHAWLTGNASSGRVVPGFVWLVGVPLLACILSGFLWWRAPADDRGQDHCPQCNCAQRGTSDAACPECGWGGPKEPSP